MRTVLRWGVPLLLVLVGLAWGAATIVQRTTRAWFERDVSLRARLAVAGAREAVETHLRSGDRAKLGGVLAAVARDDRIMGAAVCGQRGRALARNGAIPAALGCDALAPRLREGVPPEGAELLREVDGGLVHAYVAELAEDGATLGHVVVVHDLSFVVRREAAMRRFTVGAFGIVALLASILTVAVRRASWRSWTEELRRLLPPPGSRPARERPGKLFKPLLSDVSHLVAELAAERAGSPGGKWSPERLHRTLTELLHGDRVVALANREPYVHERGPDGELRVLHPASGLVTALEPVMRACGGVWVAHGSGSADRDVVDGGDHVRVPPGEESYSLRRVWLSEEEERGYYYGFSNEGLWPLCHVAHTRPQFRAADYRAYERVNRRSPTPSARRWTGPTPSCSCRTTTTRSCRG